MKLDYVEVAGFRGVRETIRIECAPGFVVITGRNGVGKSTVFDAIDYALTGAINKFNVTGAKGGGIDDHLWWVGEPAASSHYVSVGFIDDRGDRFSIRRAREGGTEGDTNEILRRLCRPNWVDRTSISTLMQTTLIRDEFIAALSLDLPEQARFSAVRAAMGAITGPDYSLRTEAVLKAATALRDNQKGLLEQAQAELGRNLTSLTEARSTADLSADISEAMRLTDAAIGSGVSGPAERDRVLRKTIADRKMKVRDIQEACARAETAVANLRAATEIEATRLAASQAASLAAARELESANQRLESALRLEAEERDKDEHTAHLAALLEHGSALGLEDERCPLCTAPRTKTEFEKALKLLAERLDDRGRKLAAAAAAVGSARTSATAAFAAQELANAELSALEGQRQSAQRQLLEVAETYSRLNFDAPADDPPRARQFLLREQEGTASLERALFVLESSSAADRIASLESRVVNVREEIEELTGKVSEAENTVEAARQIDASAKAVANEVLTEQFDTVMPLLKELYRRLRPHPEWSEIDSDFGGRVRGSLNFVVGDGRNPQFLFSSGQRRAAGLSFLLAVHLSRPWCAWETLLLDDPVQHIDDYRAVNLAEVLTAVRRTGEQVIVAVEDPALADLLCRRLRSAGDQIGRRFELRTANTGGAVIGEAQDLFPMPKSVLRTLHAS
jgi:chromosome segregation protein